MQGKGDQDRRNEVSDEWQTNLRLADFGRHVRGWRMALGLTAQQVAEQAGITRDTLRRIESGNPKVGFNNVAQVLQVLGLLDRVVEAVDPLGDDLGRARADRLRRKRVR
ncbi:MAG: helix-turn-helix domain-containing protein [Propionibacteriaceae bacterium]|nr:helix-turn-helix domain-containing protein [Propionibacteriaceae bacterium]